MSVTCPGSERVDALLERHELVGEEITSVLEKAVTARPDGVRPVSPGEHLRIA